MKRFIYSFSILLFLFIAVLPTLFSFISSVFLLGWKGFLFSKSSWPLLGKSIAMSSVSAFSSTLFGLFLTLVLERTLKKHRALIRILLIAPFFFSPYIFAVAWKDLFHLVGMGEKFIYSPWGVIFIWTMIFTPLSMLVISSQLVNCEARLEESAVIFAPYSTVIRKITIPLLKPAIFASFVLVFIMTISEFSIPAFLSVRVFSTEIFTQFSAFHNFEEAVAKGWIIIYLALILLFLERSYLTNAPFISLNVTASTSLTIHIPKSVSILLRGVVFGSICGMSGIPLFILILQSFKGGIGAFEQAIHFLAPNIVNSIFYASLGALLLVIFGLIFAFMSEEDGLSWINWILLVTFSIPSMIFGLSLIYFFNRPLLASLYSSGWIVIFAYIGRFTFITGRLIGNSLKQLPSSLKEAAIMAGANPQTVFFKILMPLISPGMFAAFFVAFILNLGELGTTIMVYPPGTSLMPIKIFTIMANAPQYMTSAMTLVALLVTIVSALLIFSMRSMLVRIGRRFYG